MTAFHFVAYPLFRNNSNRKKLSLILCVCLRSSMVKIVYIHVSKTFLKQQSLGSRMKLKLKLFNTQHIPMFPFSSQCIPFHSIPFWTSALLYFFGWKMLSSRLNRDYSFSDNFGEQQKNKKMMRWIEFTISIYSYDYYKPFRQISQRYCLLSLLKWTIGMDWQWLQYVWLARLMIKKRIHFIDNKYKSVLETTTTRKWKWSVRERVKDTFILFSAYLNAKNYIWVVKIDRIPMQNFPVDISKFVRKSWFAFESDSFPGKRSEKLRGKNHIWQSFSNQFLVWTRTRIKSNFLPRKTWLILCHRSSAK